MYTPDTALQCEVLPDRVKLIQYRCSLASPSDAACKRPARLMAYPMVPLWREGLLIRKLAKDSHAHGLKTVKETQLMSLGISQGAARWLTLAQKSALA